MSEHERIKERERGGLAKQVLENPVFKESITTMEMNLRAHMESSSSSDETVLEARRMLLVLKKVHKHIQDVMTTGVMAEMQLEEARDGRKRT